MLLGEIWTLPIIIVGILVVLIFYTCIIIILGLLRWDRFIKAVFFAFGRLMLIFSIICLPYYISVLLFIISIIKRNLHFSFFIFLMIILPVLGILSGLIYFICGINILKLRNWARLITIRYSATMFILLLPIFIFEWRSSGEGSFIIIDIPLAILGLSSLLFLIFFTRPKAKEQFK